MTSPVTPRAVLFDVDGTLYRQTPVRLAMALELAWTALAAPTSTRDVVRCLREYRRAHEHLRVTRPASGSVARAQLALAAERAGVEPSFAEAAVREWMHERPLKYLRAARRPGVVALLARLQARGVALGVLSDYEPAAKLRALGLDGYFGLALCSTEPSIDALKPDPRGFLRACAVWGLAPWEVVYVGDRPEVDAAGARAAGLQYALIGRHRDGDDERRHVYGSFTELAASL